MRFALFLSCARDMIMDLVKQNLKTITDMDKNV